MTVIDNESLQPVEPPKPRLVSILCHGCGGTGKVHRTYPSTAGGAPIVTYGRCSFCGGNKTILVEASEP